MLRFGADRIFANAEGKPPSDAELDALIDRSAKVAATAGARQPVTGYLAGFGHQSSGAYSQVAVQLSPRNGCPGG